MTSRMSSNGGFYVDEDDDMKGPAELEGASLEVFQGFINQLTGKLNRTRFGDTSEMDRKKKKHVLELKRVRSKSLQKCGFEVLCEFKNFRPQIWRRIVVPGSLLLFDLHDRVLCPVFGFCRHYHAFYFSKLPRDPKMNSFNIGMVYGTPNTESVGGSYIDLMHSRMARIEMISGLEVMICDVLKKDGDQMEWVYDLGDHFNFRLTLSRTIPPDEYKNEVNLQSGEGCNLPEDGHGAKGLAEYFHGLETNRKNNRIEENRKLQGKMSFSTNFKDAGVRFPTDPLFFDLHRAKRILQICIRSPRVYPGSMEGMFLPWSSKEYLKYKKEMKYCRTCLKREKMMKKCGNCKIVFYCSVYCQKKDWGIHKKICRRMKF